MFVQKYGVWNTEYWTTYSIRQTTNTEYEHSLNKAASHTKFRGVAETKLWLLLWKRILIWWFPVAFLSDEICTANCIDLVHTTPTLQVGTHKPLNQGIIEYKIHYCIKYDKIIASFSTVAEHLCRRNQTIIFVGSNASHEVHYVWYRHASNKLFGGWDRSKTYAKGGILRLLFKSTRKKMAMESSMIQANLTSYWPRIKQ